MYNLKARIIASVVGFLVVISLILGMFSFSFVPANHVGIVYNPFGGGLQENIVKEGFYFKKPFVDKIYKVNTQIQSLDLQDITIQTNDAQWVSFNLDVKYRVTNEDALTVFKNYKTDNDKMKEELIKPVVQKAVEQVTTQYNVVGILGEQRNEAYEKITESTTKELSKFGITLSNLTILDSDAGAEIEAAIAQEAVEQKAIDTAKQTQEKIRIQNATKLLETETQAQQKIIQAEAEAEANKVISLSVTPELNQYMEAQARNKHGWIEVLTSGEVIVENGK